MRSAVDYGPIPFTIVEQYTPTDNGSVPGLYDKVALPPIGWASFGEAKGREWALAQRGGASPTLVLPTVVVDVTESAGGGGGYATMTLYSCLDLGPLGAVEEIIFASLSASVGDDDLAALEATARDAGVAWDDADLKRVDQAGC